MADERIFSDAERMQYERPPAEVPPVRDAMVKLLFQEMVRRQMSYKRLEQLSGVSFWTVRKWRRGVRPTDETMAKALGAVGYAIKRIAVPIGGKAE